MNSSSSSWSYSSRISPTISSSRSSVVTIPTEVPYSSITIAILIELFCISLKSSEVFFCSYTKYGFLIMLFRLNAWPVGAVIRSLIFKTPTTLSGLSSYTGNLEYLVSLYILITSRYSDSTSISDISILGIIISLTLDSPKSNRLLIISFSSCSITPSSWLTSTNVRSSSSVIA